MQPRAKKRYPIVYTGPTSTTNTYSAIASTFTIIFDDSVTEELDFTKANVSSVVETRAEERYSAKNVPQPHGAEDIALTPILGDVLDRLLER